MKNKQVPSIYYTVLRLLESNERCRNDDQYLVCKVWMVNHPQKFHFLHMLPDGKFDESRPSVELKYIVDIFENMETISRVRRDIQNTLGLFPPTSWHVAKGRRIKEDIWRENMTNNFTKAQATAIMEIYIRAKQATKKNLVEIKKRIIEEHGI